MINTKVSQKNSYIIPTTVISAFPAMGKSYFGKIYPTIGRDLESSDYHWLMEDGVKVPNPAWPGNYIDTIKILEKSGMYQLVMVSSHELVRSEMAKAKIKYSNICPEDTPEMKEFVLKRMKDRHSPESFINDMSENWAKYIESMKNDKNAYFCIQVNKHTIFDWFGWGIQY